MNIMNGTFNPHNNTVSPIKLHGNILLLNIITVVHNNIDENIFDNLIIIFS